MRNAEMTDKTKMNKVQNEFVKFVNDNYNTNYNHIYWFVWAEEDEENYYEWLEEIINDFCEEYNYKYNEVVEKLNENFEIERF